MCNAQSTIKNHVSESYVLKSPLSGTNTDLTIYLLMSPLISWSTIKYLEVATNTNFTQHSAHTTNKKIKYTKIIYVYRTRRKEENRGEKNTLNKNVTHIQCCTAKSSKPSTSRRCSETSETKQCFEWSSSSHRTIHTSRAILCNAHNSFVLHTHRPYTNTTHTHSYTYIRLTTRRLDRNRKYFSSALNYISMGYTYQKRFVHHFRRTHIYSVLHCVTRKV